MCGSMLVYKTCLACHKFIHVSKNTVKGPFHTLPSFDFGLLKHITLK